MRNDTLNAADIGGWRLMRWRRALGGPESIDLYFSFAPGVSLQPGCHYLVATRDQIAGIASDARASSGLSNDTGLALVRQDGTIVDQVGLHPDSPYKEGLPLAAVGSDDSSSYARGARDTNNNAADFVLQRATPLNRLSSCSVR